ncbi:sugar phosphate isomerase/epimerase family protein [Streptomyces sp. GLT-R25]
MRATSRSGRTSKTGRGNSTTRAEEFAALAAQADGVGARLAIEFLPWSNLKTVHDGLRLVETAGHPAGGLIIDVWHTERAHTPPADLASVPASRIVGVELNDADSEVIGTLFEDTVRRRRLCGEGSFDLTGIISALRTAGWTGPWGVEILSDAHRALPVREAAEAAYRTAAAVLK